MEGVDKGGDTHAVVGKRRGCGDRDDDLGGDRVRGRGVGDLRKDTFEELEAKIAAVIRIQWSCLNSKS